MTRRILHIARREWLEQARQPVMLGIIATLYALVAGIVLVALAILGYVASDPTRVEAVGLLLGVDGGGAAAIDVMTGVVVTGFNFLVFSQFLGIAGVLAGHAVLHDRQCGTLTFLLLAPVRRAELVLGKVVGAIGPAWVLYLTINGAASLLATRSSVVAGHEAHLPTSPAWWVAFLLGGPLLALLVATVCTIASAVARDVRTAQQGVWFLVFFATLGCGFVLTNGMAAGVGVQLGVAAAAALAVILAVVFGATVITRDIGR